MLFRSDKQKLEIERKNNQNRIEVLEKNQRELQTELGKYEIRAPKSGVITKIMETEGNYRSVEGLNFLTVSGENKLFIGETDYDYKFSEEAYYEMLIDQISYPCSYLSEELSEDGIRKVIFQLEESEFTLDNPLFGILQIVLEIGRASCRERVSSPV